MGLSKTYMMAPWLSSCFSRLLREQEMHWHLSQELKRAV